MKKGASIVVGECMMFVDDDERVYMYYSADGVYGVELDQNDLRKFKSAPTHE